MASFFVILARIPGGWSHVLTWRRRRQVPGLRLPLSASNLPYTFWAGVIGGCFLTTASHGTDQLIVQRLLSARSESDSRKALFASWVVVFFQFTLFLLIGVLLWVLYREHGCDRRQSRSIGSIPLFVWQNLPWACAG